MAGPLPSWKADKRLFGGNQTSNATLMTIDFILNAVKERIHGYETNRMLYVDKVGFVLTYKDYVQSPHLDIIGRLHSYIIHIPLCKNGGWIYLWERGDGATLNRQMIHIPFGSMLVLRNDVWHGGIVGGGVTSAFTRQYVTKLTFP